MAAGEQLCNLDTFRRLPCQGQYGGLVLGETIAKLVYLVLIMKTVYTKHP
jgi:hypothetical protein